MIDKYMLGIFLGGEIRWKFYFRRKKVRKGISFSEGKDYSEKNPFFRYFYFTRNSK